MIGYSDIKTYGGGQMSFIYIVIGGGTGALLIGFLINIFDTFGINTKFNWDCGLTR
jgi:hypothetical protein